MKVSSTLSDSDPVSLKEFLLFPPILILILERLSLRESFSLMRVS